MTQYLVDVSHHDRNRRGKPIDWAAVKRAGFIAACVRTTYGDPGGVSYATPYVGESIRGSRAAGLITGSYHNLIRGSEASINRQVAWMRSEMDKHGSTWAMLDVERYEELLSQNLEPRISDVRAFCRRWKQTDKRALLLYLPKWVWGHMGNPDLSSCGVPLVASDYGSNLSGTASALYAGRGGDTGRGWASYGGARVAIWQFGSNGKVPGCSSKTDVNAFRGTASELRTLLGQGAGDMELTDIVYERTNPDGTKVNRSVRNILGSLDVWALRNDQRIASVQAQIATLLQEMSDDPEIDVQLTPEQVELLGAKVATLVPSASSIADAVLDEVSSRTAE